MLFYPDIKAHISPSALAAWKNSRASFVKSYFLKDKSPETAAMKAGKEIHALIEAGLLTVKHKFSQPEKELVYLAESTGVSFKVLGKPDNYELGLKNVAFFVDYKSGKENTWEDVKLAGDWKMKATAWLVWQETGKPEVVHGYIEYVPTVWNQQRKEVEPTGGETEVVAESTYTASEMERFTQEIIKTCHEINEAYLEWLDSTDEFVNQGDVAEYARLDEEIERLEIQKELVKERIKDQLDMGKKKSLPTPFGSFYFTTKSTWKFPKTLEFKSGETVLTLEQLEKLEIAAEVSKEKFKQENEPEKGKPTLQFRAKKK